MTQQQQQMPQQLNVMLQHDGQQECKHSLKGVSCC